MIYPADDQGNSGEHVSYGYNAQMGLESVLSGFPQPYVYTTDYDAAGRIVERELGINAVVMGYEYYPWTEQGGRLKKLLSGTPADPDGLQDLRYTYDDMGTTTWATC